jgi:hypothetical protein
MDPRDLLRAFPDGIACTVCDRPVPATRIQLLARREDVAFIQIACGACRSTTLGFLAESATGTTGADGTPFPTAQVRPIISADDVIEMHQFLAEWQGDARSLVAEPGRERPGSESSVPPR